MLQKVDMPAHEEPRPVVLPNGGCTYAFIGVAQAIVEACEKLRWKGLDYKLDPLSKDEPEDKIRKVIGSIAGDPWHLIYNPEDRRAVWNLRFPELDMRIGERGRPFELDCKIKNGRSVSYCAEEFTAWERAMHVHTIYPPYRLVIKDPQTSRRLSEGDEPSWIWRMARPYDLRQHRKVAPEEMKWLVPFFLVTDDVIEYVANQMRSRVLIPLLERVKASQPLTERQLIENEILLTMNKLEDLTTRLAQLGEGEENQSAINT